MTAPRISDALAHLQAAIEALTNEGVQINLNTGAETALEPLDACIGDDLIQIDRRIGAAQPTLIGAIGHSVSDVTLTIDGRTHAGWEDVRISRAIDALTGSFTLSLSRRERTADEPRTIAAGAACAVAIDGETVISGWIDRVSPQKNANDFRLSVSGRDRAADLVDCSAIAKPGSWRNTPMETIVRALVAPFGLTVHVIAPTGGPIRRFAIQQGETVQAAIERLCRFRALLVFSRADGSIEIGTPATGASVCTLTDGVNTLEVNADHDVSERYASYHVKGQSAGDDDANGRAVAQVKASATDSAVARYRPLLLVAEEQADKAGLEKRAKWEANVRAARGQTVYVTVQGWRDPKGGIWAPNVRIDLSAPDVYVEATMLVIAAELRRSNDEGTVARLTLQRPEAWQQLAEPEGKDASALSKSGKAA